MARTVAASLEKPGMIMLRELDLKPGPRQVLVEINQASICGTDRIAFRGDTSAETEFPIFPWGHEGGGTVVEVGEKVHELAAGDKVMSFGIGTFGTHALYEMPFGCLPAPEGVDMRVACLGEPLSCAVYASQIVTRNMELGDVVAVVGAGFAGQILSQGIKKGGADSVIVIDVADEKLKLAKELGADIVVNPKTERVSKSIMDLTNGRGVDVVVEASGTGEGLNTASEIVRHNGTIAIYSHYMKPITVNLFRWHEDCLKIVHTCLVHRTDEETIIGVRDAFRLIKKGIFDVTPLISKTRFKLTGITEAFELGLEESASIKTLVLP